MRKCISSESSKEDLWGKLICTNFKVSFIVQDAPIKEVSALLFSRAFTVNLEFKTITVK